MSTDKLGASRTVVVLAGSRHGGTCEVADRVARTLETELSFAWDVVRSDLSDLVDIDDVDAVILGSAVHFGQWRHLAGQVLDHLTEAPLFDLWLFSTSPRTVIEDQSSIDADLMVSRGEAIEHKVFGGPLHQGSRGWSRRTAANVARAVSGGHRDWDQVDDWSRHVAGQLGREPTSAR